METCDISVSEIIDDYLRKKFLNDNSRDNKVFHPSEFYGCKRKIAYQYYESIGVIKLVSDPYSVNTGLIRVFDNGHKVHDRYKSYFSDSHYMPGVLKGYWQCNNKFAHNGPKIFGKEEKYGIFYPKEKCECGCDTFEYVEVGFSSEKYNMSGHVDVILFLPNEQHIIVDFKSIRSRSFIKLFGKPQPKHETQMQLYLFLSDLEIGKFLYENKDDQQIKEFTVVRNQKAINRLLDFAEQLKYIVTYVGPNGERKLPPRSNSLYPDKDNSPDVETYNPQHKECLGCKFRSNCWKKVK